MYVYLYIYMALAQLSSDHEATQAAITGAHIMHALSYVHALMHALAEGCIV